MIIIDPGHGGSDYGGGSNNLFKEKDLVLKISKYQLRRFKELGLDAVLTRDSDVDLPPSKRISKIKEIGRNANNILISNHINKAQGQFQGSEIIYSFRQSPDLANEIADELEKSGRSINRLFTRKNKNGNDYYYVIRNSLPNQSVLVEYGFADSPEDSKALLNNYEVYAEAVVKAVTNYLGFKYTPPSSSFYFYTVKNGDSLYKIANKTGISVKEIKEYNNLKTDTLKINQVIKIPTEKRFSIKHYALRNESIQSIANRYNTTIEKIKKANNINDEINENSVLIIPLEKTLVPYVVKPGDSLYKIAVNNNLSLYQLISINHLENSTITPGDIIYL